MCISQGSPEKQNQSDICKQINTTNQCKQINLHIYKIEIDSRDYGDEEVP